MVEEHTRVPRRIAFAYVGVCLLGLVVELVARATYYSVLGLPTAVQWIPESLMQFQLRNFRWTTQLSAFVILALIGIAVSRWLLDRPRVLIPAMPWEARGFSTWFWVISASLCLWHNYLFDADPFMARICWASFPLLALWFAWRPGRPLYAILALALLVTGWMVAPDAACRTAIVVWGACLLVTARLGRRTLRPASALFVGLLLMPLGTTVFAILWAGVIPGPLRPLAHVMESEGYAYNFCEFPERHQLFLTVPRCTTGTLDGCDAAYVAEYDTRDFSKRKVHRFFDDQFTGGLRELLCVGDVVQVTMNLARLGDHTYLSNVMQFRADDPTQFQRTIFNDGIRTRHPEDLLGHRYAYDRRRDAVFYVSEWTNTVFRLDRKTGVVNEAAGAALPYKPFQLLNNFGLFTSTEAIDERRDRIYLSQWGDGAHIWGLDLGNLQLAATLDTHDTGSFATVVDGEKDRLIASGLWGINVFDLATGAVIARRRLGPGVRDAQIDRRHGLIYLGTTFGGNVYVLDRDTLALLGRLPTGVGGRRPYISRDGRWLYVTDQHYTYRYETADLARFFRPAGDGAPQGAPSTHADS